LQIHRQFTHRTQRARLPSIEILFAPSRLFPENDKKAV